MQSQRVHCGWLLCVVALVGCGKSSAAESVDAATVTTCTEGAQRCTNNTVQTCDASGTFQDDTETCTQRRLTCLESNGSASCSGVCAPAQTQCDGNAVQSCTPTGAWSTGERCADPDQVCSSGACVVGSVAGDSTPGTDNFDVPDNVWFLEQIVPDASGYVMSLRVITRQAGGVGRMAIWDDASGAPGAIRAQTHSFDLLGGVDGDTAILPSATQVVAGQPYWIGAKFVNGAELYQSSSSGTLGYDYGQMFGANPWTTMTPFPTNSAGTVPGVSLNLFMVVGDVIPEPY